MDYNRAAYDEIAKYVVCDADNPVEKILLKANGEDLGWMDDYGMEIQDVERRMASFWFSYDKEKIVMMADHIVGAFLHGFISQSRDIAGRTLVRFHYSVGQEALALETMRAFGRKGFRTSVQMPTSLSSTPTMPTPKDEAELEAWKNAYTKAFNTLHDELKDTCGLAGIGQFGQTTSTTGKSKTEEERRLSLLLLNHIRGLESSIILPSTISFCKVAFPNSLVGEDFEEIFDEVMAMNLVDSTPYELMQQKLIDAMDLCERVEIKGAKGNGTDLSISLWPIRNPEKGSNFSNCGGDLNIPYGEVFTTPRLEGTSGIYHVKEIYLAGVSYTNLRLVFKDGYIISATSDDGEDYVASNLLFPHRTLTMGEYAIGTNTDAYAIAVKHNLLAKTPILWTEKMGPHVAVGDPCFARGEDGPVYNIYDGKEMCARENERTRKRATEDVYFNKHVDITLPYGDVAYLRGVKADGSIIDIIKDGRFVLEGTEGLNSGLEAIR